MRRDFHYYALYAIARYAGMHPAIAEVIAYASEQVDDAKAEAPRPLANGGQHCPIRSAHSLLDPSFYESRAALSVYMPFHFFPSLKGRTFTERAICKPNSPGIAALKQQTLKQLRRPHGPYALGIALHILADSFAHEGFSALRDQGNQISHLQIHTSGLLDIALPAFSSLLPPIAHLQATTCPDEPACIWTYCNCSGQTVHANNTHRYIEASEAIYNWLSNDVRRHQPYWFNNTPLPFALLKHPLEVLFSLNMILTDRIFAWQQAFDYQLFTPQDAPEPWQVPNYDPEAWQATAFNGQEGEPFSETHYFLMHTALAEHLHFCRYQLFPKHQIYI